MKSLILILISLFVFFLIWDLDQKTTKHSNYNEADQNDFFQTGWIPSALIFESMSDIYLRNNIDLNSCIFSFSLPKSDIEVVKQIMQKTSMKFEKPRRIRIPKWWIRSVINKNNYGFISEGIITDTVFYEIDEQNNKIFGWIK